MKIMRSLCLFRFPLHLITMYLEDAQQPAGRHPPQHSPPLGADQDPSADLLPQGTSWVLWQGQLRTCQPLPVHHLIFLSLDVAIINLSAYSGYSMGCFGQAPLIDACMLQRARAAPLLQVHGELQWSSGSNLSWGKILEDETGVWGALSFCLLVYILFPQTQRIKISE